MKTNHERLAALRSIAEKLKNKGLNLLVEVEVVKELNDIADDLESAVGETLTEAKEVKGNDDLAPMDSEGKTDKKAGK